MIIDENINGVWKEVIDSLSRQHIDEANNRKKRISKEQPVTSTTTTTESSTEQTPIFLSEQEKPSLEIMSPHQNENDKTTTTVTSQQMQNDE